MSHDCRCGRNLRERFPVSQDGVWPSLESDSSVPLLSSISIADRLTDLFGQKRRRMGDGARSLAGEGQDLETDPSIDPTRSVRGISGAWSPEPIPASMSFERTCVGRRDYRVGLDLLPSNRSTPKVSNAV